MKAQEHFKISIAGSGNVGNFLAIQLYNAGYEINQIYSRTIENSLTLAERVNAEAIEELSKLNHEIDILILALPDQIIPLFCEQLYKFARFNESTIVSVSGSVQLNEISRYFDKSGVLYPLQSFTMKTNPDPEKVPLCLEASDENTLKQLNIIANSISDDIRILNSRQRLALHLAAVFASNFTNHLIAVADEILEEEGIESDILMPLLHETISRLDKNSAIDMQTGPAIRNDQNTIAKHIELLSAKNKDNVAEIYKLLSNNIQSYSVNKKNRT